METASKVPEIGLSGRTRLMNRVLRRESRGSGRILGHSETMIAALPSIVCGRSVSRPRNGVRASLGSAISARDARTSPLAGLRLPMLARAGAGRDAARGPNRARLRVVPWLAAASAGAAFLSFILLHMQPNRSSGRKTPAGAKLCLPGTAIGRSSLFVRLVL